jgi:hypothetical protein
MLSKVRLSRISLSVHVASRDLGRHDNSRRRVALYTKCTESERMAPNESVVYAELDDEAVLLNVETGLYFGLDPIGVQIWKLLTDGVSKDQIADRLLSVDDPRTRVATPPGQQAGRW